MASGGLPPLQTMPPPRGWTPGATSESAQSPHDETIANAAWEVCIEKFTGKTKFSRVKFCFDINQLWLVVTEMRSKIFQVGIY